MILIAYRVVNYVFLSLAEYKLNMVITSIGIENVLAFFCRANSDRFISASFNDVTATVFFSSKGPKCLGCSFLSSLLRGA